jgi:hypothetical protein
MDKNRSRKKHVVHVLQIILPDWTLIESSGGEQMTMEQQAAVRS